MRRTYIMALLASAGCITVPVTETLKPGQQRSAHSRLMIALPGGGPTIALPSITAEYRQGGGERWDWNVGTHLLRPSSVRSVVVGVLSAQRVLPAPSIARDELPYVFSNHLDDRKPADSRPLAKQ